MEPNVTLPRLLAGLATSTAGLSSTEAARRLRDQGPNEVATRTLRTKVFELARVIANPLAIIFLFLVAGTASSRERRPRCYRRWPTRPSSSPSCC